MAVRSLQRSNLVNTVQIDRGVVLCPYIQVLIAIPWSPHKRATATIAAAPPRQIPTFWLDPSLQLRTYKALWGREGLMATQTGVLVACWKSSLGCPDSFSARKHLCLRDSRWQGNHQAWWGVLKQVQVHTCTPQSICVPEVRYSSEFCFSFRPSTTGTLWLTRTHPEVSGWFGLISDHLRAWTKATSSHMSSRTISRWVQANGCCKESIAPPAASLVFQNVHLFLLLFFPLVLICIVITSQTECSMRISLSLDTSWILKA